MSLAPVLHRTVFYDKLPGNGGSYLLDWALVNTSLGAMIEARGPVVPYAATRALADEGFDAIQPMDVNSFQRLHNFSGEGMYPSTYR